MDPATSAPAESSRPQQLPQRAYRATTERIFALEALWSSIKNNAGWRVGYSAEFTAAVERLRKLENSL